MPPMDKPPMSPEVQGQAPPPGLGQGMAQGQQNAGKDPLELAVETVTKILTGISDETFKPYAMQAIAKLKIGLGMAKQKQPQSGPMQPPPGPGGPPGGGAQVPTPPVPGQMPG